MREFLIDANEELKRADHLIYVSLKYTRTVDVIKSIIERFINSCDFLIDGLLTIEKERGKIESNPPAPIQKTNILLKLYPDNKEMINFIEWYLLLRKLTKADYTASQEYRRHVTMTAFLDEKGTYEVDIDKIYEFYEIAKSALLLIRELASPEGEEAEE